MRKPPSGQIIFHALPLPNIPTCYNYLMIKAIVMDVDGVIVGKKLGDNYPLPNEKVIQKLNEVHKKGIPIILCTAKFSYAINEIIERADLRNPHITDGGALVIDPLENKIITKHVFDKKLAEDIIKSCLGKNIYLEIYGADEYFVQKSQSTNFTKKRAELLQKEPTIVNSLSNQIPQTEIIKIIGFVKTQEEKPKIENTINNCMNKINFMWSHHPAIAPFQIGIITVKGVSKKSAALQVLNYLKISPDETLGIGDLLSDWNFMEICKYVATVGDESVELKKLAQTKKEENFLCASSVDKDGFIDIINYFIS